MRPRITAEIGDRFGKRVVAAKLPPTRGSGHARYSMVCDCGQKSVLRNPEYRKRCKNCEHDGGWTDRLGESRTRLYIAWHAMMHRCERIKPTERSYRHYAGRGIRVCEEWKDWPTFRKWAMETGYEYGLVLDRINPNKGYYPENCEWTTRAENTRRIYQQWRRYHTPIEMLWGHC